ncbi:hypothetical protein QQX98_011699 [Neonectria punicea]|uniref:Fungal N-terminal domain-containing protein n=1 Tax=Neonectria punicea TaxID=979145 RepID=A0ABR1GL18_9HYPO
MAELFGVAAGVAGFVSLLTQIMGGIETLREIRSHAERAPAELDNLTSELAFLAHLMREVIAKAADKDDIVHRHCQSSCDQVVRGLAKLKSKLSTELKASGRQKILRLLALKHWKQDIEDLQSSIQGAKINLIL